VDAISLFVGKENANERKESLLSICRVQLFFCKVTTFPRNFQGFREKYLKRGGEDKFTDVIVQSAVAQLQNV
jgi:hypothetical protein